MADWKFNDILSRMLNTVPDELDKREGSIIYDALAPAALALAEQYNMLTQLADMFFADTASGGWLDRVAGNFGIIRKEATKAERLLSCFDAEGKLIKVNVGSRFSVNGAVFSVAEQREDLICKVVCEQPGTEGNSYSGAILPIDNIPGLAKAVLDAEAFMPARDRETDEQLRSRLYDSVRSTPFGGNRSDYLEKTMAISGVGRCAVFTASDGMGAGNVGLVIADDEGSPASEQLIATVEKLFCGDGSGNGLAPIGHHVAVNSCEWLDIDISAKLVLKEGSSVEVVKPFAEQAVTDYVTKMSFEDATVFTARLMSALLTCHQAVLDVTEVTINGAAQNMPLIKSFEKWQLARIGAVAITQG